MADKPPSGNGPASGTKAGQNPALRMMGLPRLSRLKLPSRNWLIFLSITGSWTAALLYDRYHKKRAQQRWCNLVSHLQDESLPINMMPRKITIFLAAPPGDGLRAAREHFHEYVKPILVAGAMDWEVIEGRKEGEVRAGLAEKIRKLRKRKGEKAEGESTEEDEEDLVKELRRRTGTNEWEGVQGDLILGRHTWKEYIRGLHEGWLGPLDAPQTPETSEAGSQSPDATSPESPTSATLPAGEDPSSETPAPTPTPEATPPKPTKSSPTPPYITPSAYTTTPLPSTLPSTLSPSIPLPLPHLLGFFNTPIRLYRFLTRRHLANTTGASVAALVLATRSRPYGHTTQFASAIDPDDANPSTVIEGNAVASAGDAWEQEIVLKNEEGEWHKIAWKANEEGDTKERLWQEKMVLDARIAERMSMFELEAGAEARAEELAEQKRQEEDNLITKVRRWTGWETEGRKGWDMGLEGNEDD